MKHKLTVKQQKFCDEYIKSGNATEAALKAGYRSRTAYSIGNENLKKPELKKYIEEKIKELESAKLATAQETLEYLTSVMRGEQTETVVTAKGLYKNVEVSAKDRITAAKELLKRYPVDPLAKAQLRKIKADATIAEYQAEQLTSDDKDISVNINFDVPKEDENASKP